MTKELKRPPTISVIMSVYNGGQFLALAIQSILDQTFKNFEFIIIDDGSTDDSAKVIKSFNDPRIKFIHQKNIGLVASLNKGIMLAKGEFIARMDADDISLPERFEKELIAITADQSIGVVGSFYTFIDTADRPFATHVSPTLYQDLKFTLLHANPFGHGSTLIRKTAVERSGMYRDNYPAAEDYDLWRRIAREWRLVQIPESLYWWRENPGGVSSTKDKTQLKSTNKIMNEQWKEVIPAIAIFDIIRHHKVYKRLDSLHADQVANSYLDNLVYICLGALARHKPRTFIRTSTGIALTSPRKFFKLMYLIGRRLVKKFVKRMGLSK